VLLRATETAEILAPSLDELRDGDPLSVTTDCELCELHPGEADAMSWTTFTERFGVPDWDNDPSVPIAPGGESWTSFVERAARAVAKVATQHRGELVVIVCHAGVIEAAMLAFLPVDLRRRHRDFLRTEHASLTEWVVSDPGGDDERWILRRYNDVTPLG
jgi:probable phosphoglycerate mutase